MSQKPIIAIDIDDVLADSTETFRKVVNKHVGVDLQKHHYKVPGDYWHYYESVWQANGIGDKITHDDFIPQMRTDQSHVAPMAGSRQTLGALKKHYGLVVLSARELDWYDATIDWIDKNYPGIFKQVLLAGGQEGVKNKHKGAICHEIGASWLIDDNVEHAETALREGVNVIVFGDYGWHHKGLPDRAVACKTWADVEAYFAANKMH